MKRLVRSAVAALILAGASAANALPFTGMTLFGDSLSDNGNAFLALGSVTLPPFPLVPTAPYPRGGGLLPALSNGPIWAEVVGSALGLPVVPSLAGGTNYAFAGADTGPLPGVPPGQTPTLTQQFFAPSFTPPPPAPQFPLFGAGPVVPGTLYSVWGGGNDIRRALEVYQDVLVESGDSNMALAAASAVVSAGVTNVATILGALAAAGAQHILSLNVPDIGLAPAVSFLPAGTNTLATLLSAGFNSALAAAIDGLESAFALDVIEVDVFTLVQGIVADPSAYGLANATGTCVEVGGFGTCADPGSYLFWDGIHPTAAGHRIIAGAVLSALVPEPGTIALLLVGIVALAPSVRRARPVRVQALG